MTLKMFLVVIVMIDVCRPAPKNEDEMMHAIFDEIDRLMNIIRPRKLLYMAIDGVVSKAHEIL